jgi:hypothetical protein
MTVTYYCNKCGDEIEDAKPRKRSGEIGLNLDEEHEGDSYPQFVMHLCERCAHEFLDDYWKPNQ